MKTTKINIPVNKVEKPQFFSTFDKNLSVFT